MSLASRWKDSNRPVPDTRLVAPVLTLIAFLLSPGGPVPGNSAFANTDDDTPEVAYTRFDPVVIFNDGRDEMTLEARVVGSVAKVEARQRYSDGMIRVDGQDMEPGQRFELFHVEDDIYARDGITSEHSPQRARVDIIVTDENGEEHNLYGRSD